MKKLLLILLLIPINLFSQNLYEDWKTNKILNFGTGNDPLFTVNKNQLIYSDFNNNLQTIDEFGSEINNFKLRGEIVGLNCLNNQILILDKRNSLHITYDLKGTILKQKKNNVNLNDVKVFNTKKGGFYIIQGKNKKSVTLIDANGNAVKKGSFKIGDKISNYYIDFFDYADGNYELVLDLEGKSSFKSYIFNSDFNITESKIFKTPNYLSYSTKIKNNFFCSRISRNSNVSEISKVNNENEILWKKRFDVDYVYSIIGTNNNIYIIGEKFTKNFKDKHITFAKFSSSFGLVEKSISKEMREWEKKGKYEKSEDYKQRVNDITRKKTRDIFSIQVINIYGNKEFENIKRQIKLGSYDTESELFFISFGVIGNGRVKVPIEEAEVFENNFHSMKYNKSFKLVNKEVKLDKLIILFPKNDKKYDCEIE